MDDNSSSVYSIDFSLFIIHWYYGFSFIICDSLDFIYFLLLFLDIYLKIRIVFLHFQLFFFFFFSKLHVSLLEEEIISSNQQFWSGTNCCWLLLFFDLFIYLFTWASLFKTFYCWQNCFIYSSHFDSRVVCWNLICEEEKRKKKEENALEKKTVYCLLSTVHHCGGEGIICIESE